MFPSTLPADEHEMVLRCSDRKRLVLRHGQIVKEFLVQRQSSKRMEPLRVVVPAARRLQRPLRPRGRGVRHRPLRDPRAEGRGPDVHGSKGRHVLLRVHASARVPQPQLALGSRRAVGHHAAAVLRGAGSASRGPSQSAPRRGRVPAQGWQPLRHHRPRHRGIPAEALGGVEGNAGPVATAVVVANLVIDLLYGVLDPRIRYA